MKRQRNSFMKITTGFAVVGCLLFGSLSANADDSLDRLLKQSAAASKTKSAAKKTPAPNVVKASGGQSAAAQRSMAANPIPSKIDTSGRERQTSHNASDDINEHDSAEFGSRNQFGSARRIAYPKPLAAGKRYGQQQPQSIPDVCLPNVCPPGIGLPGGIQRPTGPRRDEYIFDGSDRGEKVHVDQAWNVGGLQTEDTIGHFDTLDGRRLVTPSNRVAIYAPRFGAVRKLDGVFNARLRTPVGELEEKTPIARASGNDQSSSTKQNFSLNRIDGSRRASGFVDRTRGVLADSVVHLFGARNTFHAFENLSLIRFGKFSKAESARLNIGLQSALVWEDNLGLQVVTKKASPIIVRDVKTAQEYVRYDSKDGAILRVTKIASKIAARTGEIVDFTLRFDNLSGKPIGNVTIIDNLTRRLEYVPNSAESSLKADFISEQNDGGSLMLRWEITEPVAAHTGGIIRFQCRVR